MLPETERLETEEQLRQEILAGGDVPRHVAVIMDGNGRWARRRRRPRVFGHLAGRHSVRQTVIGCRELGVEVLSLYTFSVENWQRPATEVSALMRILQQTLREQREEMRENGIRLQVIGRPEDLPRAAQDTLNETTAYLAGGKDMLLNLALSYGGRTEITRAARAIAREVREGRLDPESVDEAVMARHLYTAGLPDPDLLIRTSGEVRISNFMLWQVAYSEIWVTPVLWPDFRKEHLFRAVLDYQHRERRFGRVR
jgi:undecaprenyl diphosphate synthase